MSALVGPKLWFGLATESLRNQLAFSTNLVDKPVLFLPVGIDGPASLTPLPSDLFLKGTGLMSKWCFSSFVESGFLFVSRMIHESYQYLVHLKQHQEQKMHNQDVES